MQIVTQRHEETIEVKKSVFTAILVPFKDFKMTLEELKQKHPKANHVVWAYRSLNEYKQIAENQTDDGEPKGCAGVPCLNVLRGPNIVNSAVFVVRYFGGIKLGKGGMVRGYSGAVKEVLAHAALELFEELSLVEYSTPYKDVRRYEHFFTSNGLGFGNREFLGDEVRWSMQLTDKQKALLDEFMHSND